MPLQHVDEILHEAERRALIRVVRGHPNWTLERLLAHLDGPRGKTLARLTIADLRDHNLGAVLIPNDGGPPIDHAQRERAERLKGEAFLACIRRVLERAPGPVGAAYLRARVGGPRWKVQTAMRELEERGEVERSGVTSATRYALLPVKPRTRRGGSRATEPCRA